MRLPPLGYYRKSKPSPPRNAAAIRITASWGIHQTVISPVDELGPGHHSVVGAGGGRGGDCAVSCLGAMPVVPEEWTPSALGAAAGVDS